MRLTAQAAAGRARPVLVPGVRDVRWTGDRRRRRRRQEDLRYSATVSRQRRAAIVHLAKYFRQTRDRWLRAAVDTAIQLRMAPVALM